MQFMKTMGEPLTAHLQEIASHGAPDWESLRLFLEVVRSGSFRSAAERLSISFSVLRRRVASLEDAIGVPLLTRHVHGIRLTIEGQKIFDAARQMELASFGVLRAKNAIHPDVSGTVKIAVTEGTGTFWLAPRLVEFQRAYPSLLIHLNCAMNPADVSNLEADIAVQLQRPESPDLRVVKIGRLHTMPFAAISYLNTYGVPASTEELRQHRFVLHIAEQTQHMALFQKLFPNLPWVGVVAVQTNVASAHLWAVAKGAGIGWLPTYTRLIGGRKIVPIESGPRFAFDIWLTYHPDMTRIPRVRRTIDWVKDAFDSRKFPWFGEDFIHPYDLPKAYQGEPLINMFEGFIQQEHETAIHEEFPIQNDTGTFS